MKKPSIHVVQQCLFEADDSNIVKKQNEMASGDYIFDILDALNAPVLTFSAHWADTIPKRLMDIVPLARMKSLMQSEQLATNTECAIYIYTRSLEAPMDLEWTDIYLHVGCKTLEDWFGENHWKETGAPKELSDWHHTNLNRLRTHIYNKRRQILKGHLRGQGK